MLWLTMAYSLACLPLAFWWCCCGCSLCAGGGPSRFQIDLANIGDAICDCAAFNGSFILTQPAICSDFFSNLKCGWQYGPEELAVCSGSQRYRITMGIYIVSSFVAPYTDYIVEIRVYNYNTILHSCTPLYIFRKHLGATKPRCKDFSLFDLPFAGSTSGSNPLVNTCDFYTPGATCKVSYIP